MKEQILKVSEHLKNGTIDEHEAQRLLLYAFGITGSVLPLSVNVVAKMLRDVSKETWMAQKGNLLGWEEWWIERNSVNLNKE